MATPAQVANRAQPIRPDRHYPATITVAGTRPTVAIQPGGAATTATPVDAVAYTVGQRVLVLVTSHGNYILGRI